MKVLLVHQLGNDHGSGALIAMYRLHRGLQAAGIDSTIACRLRRLDGNDIVELPRSRRLEKLLGKVTWRLGLNDIHCVSSYKLARFAPFLEADVVNIHGWHSNFFSYLALPKLCRRRPVIGTFHDMWNFTGHCAYSFDCDRWKSGCGRCPYPDTYPPVARDATALSWKLKRRTYRRSAMTVVSTSSWLDEQIAQSIMGHLPRRLIRHGVDTDLYGPVDRTLARRALKLPQDKHVILFAAMAVTNWTKGGDLLAQALKALPPVIRNDTILLLMGDGSAALARDVELPAVPLGYVVADRLKALAYSAADVFVLPSRAEVQGIVMLESMACGTPVVAFRVGGTPEPIEDGVNGLLADPEDPAALRDAIAQLLEDRPRRETMGEKARQTIIDRYGIERYVRDYVRLYEEVAAGAHAS